MTDESKYQRDLENLIVGHFDGSLTADQEKDLAEVLAASAEAKQTFLSYMRMEGRLHSLGRDGFLREPIVEPAIASEPADLQPSAVTPAGHGGHPMLRLIAASTSLAVCAAVLLMLLSGVLWPSSVSASSVLQKAQAAAAELVDRTYLVMISRAGESSRSRELWVDVRGGGRFVVRPVNGAYVMGNDGTDYWVTRQSGPVWVTNDFRSLAPELKRMIPERWLVEIAASPNEPLLLEMADLLALIERKHDVELIDSDSVSEHHVRATLRSGRRNAPERIDFWADVDSGVALRAEVEWSNGRKTRFELLESLTLSDQWYHHSKHATGREVKRLGSDESQ